MIQRFKRWWYRLFGVTVRRDFTYMIDTDEYMLEKPIDGTEDS